MKINTDAGIQEFWDLVKEAESYDLTYANDLREAHSIYINGMISKFLFEKYGF